MRECDGSAAQQWTLAAGQSGQSGQAPDRDGGALPGSLVSTASGQCLDVDGCQSPTIGTATLMWPCNSVSPGNNCNSTNQRWSLGTSGQLTTAMESWHGASRSLRRALLTLQVNPGSHYRCGKST